MFTKDVTQGAVNIRLQFFHKSNHDGSLAYDSTFCPTVVFDRNLRLRHSVEAVHNVQRREDRVCCCPLHTPRAAQVVETTASCGCKKSWHRFCVSGWGICKIWKSHLSIPPTSISTHVHQCASHRDKTLGSTVRVHLIQGCQRQTLRKVYFPFEWRFSVRGVLANASPT